MKHCLLLIIALATISACTLNDKDDIHPVADKFPYADADADIPVTSIEPTYGNDLGESVIDPAQSLFEKPAFLKYADPTMLSTLPLPDGDLWEGELEVLSYGNIVFLDKMSNRLYQSDPESGEWSLLAEAGRGPGDLMFARDMNVEGEELCVIGSDGRISIFNCSVVPCAFEGIIRTGDIFAHSAIVEPDRLILMGQPSSLTSPSDTVSNLNSLAALNQETGEFLSF